MKMKTLLMIFIGAVLVFGVAEIGLSEHDHIGPAKGTVTKIKITEVEVTVKDENDKELKVRTKETGDFKIGDRVVVKDGRISKEIKPITGGY